MQALLAAQSASWPTAGEERVADRARQLIRGRGWPTEKIRPFFLEDRQLEQLLNEFNDCQVEPDKISRPFLPWTIGPTAVGIPRLAVTDLNELELTRVVIHEFVHARSLALPQRTKLPANWSESLGLYQLSEGITELIAEEILPLSSRMAQAAPLLVVTREWSAELSQQAGLDLPALERLAIPEVFQALSEALGYSLPQLAGIIEQRTASYQQQSIGDDN